MQLFRLSTIILLSITAVHAQTGVQTNGALDAAGTGAVTTPCPPSGLSTGGTAANTSIGAGMTAAGCASNQPNVPTTSAPPLSGSTFGAGTTTGSASTAAAGATSQPGASGSISAPAATNPQAALQLPGEAPNNATQTPSSTTSAAVGSGSAAGGISSSTLCGPTVTTSAGVSNPGGLFVGTSLGGC